MCIRDSTALVVKQYCNDYPNISYYYQENAGQGVARNVGLSYATGEYIWFVDSDDWIKERCIKSLLDYVKKLQLDICLFPVTKVDGEKKYIKDDFAHFDEIAYSLDEFAKMGKMTYSPCNYLFLRVLSSSNNICFLSGIYHEDIEFNTRLIMEATRIGHYKSSEGLYYYRYTREGSTMNNRSEPSLRKHILSLFIVDVYKRQALASDKATTLAMQMPYVTHELNDGLGNQILAHLHSLAENWGQNIYPIFIPDYLDGADEVLNITYYDLLPAVDLTVFASYYEPWGYTPLESVAFGVPTLTTDKAGFGMWAMETNTKNCLRYGAKALEREDDGFESLAESIAQKIARFSSFPKEMVAQSKQRAKKLAQKASWHCFYAQYLEAYSEAINRKPSKEN